MHENYSNKGSRIFCVFHIEKIILSLNPGMDSSYNGIKSINLIDWLISE